MIKFQSIYGLLMLRVKNFIVSEESLVLKFSLEFGQTFILSVDIRLCLFHDFLYINSFPAKDFFLWFQTFPSFRLREDVLKRFCERWTNLLETHLVETIYCPCTPISCQWHEDAQHLSFDHTKESSNQHVGRSRCSQPRSRSSRSSNSVKDIETGMILSIMGMKKKLL